MRALLRTVTGSPRPSPKSKAKEARYSVSDVTKAWNSISATIATNRDSNAPTKNAADQLASLSKNIDVLVDALASEATAYAMDESTGPCLEYMLTNDVLSSLVEQSLSDTPTGALGVVIKAFDSLVVLLGDEFIALASRSISKLLKGCFAPPSSAEKGHAKDGSNESADMQRSPSTNYRSEPYSSQLASLLCGICSRIKAHPDLLPIFFMQKRIGLDRYKQDSRTTQPSSAGPKMLKVLKSPTPSNSSLSTASSTQGASDSISVTTPGDTSTTTVAGSSMSANNPDPFTNHSMPYQLPLLTYLLKYIHRDGRTGEFARAGIVFLVDLAMSVTGSAKHDGSTDSKNSKRRTLPASARRPSLQTRPSESSANGTHVDTVPLHIILASYLARSDLAEMVGAGIGALYGLLPAKIYVPPLPTSLPGAPVLEATPSRAGDVFDAEVQEAADHQDYLQDLRSDGYAIQADQDLQNQIDSWCRVVQFAQDLVGRAQSFKEGFELSRRILTSIRTAFLQNTLYPSILESSTTDGTGTAILTYLEAMFSLLESEGSLSETILTFLSGQHDIPNKGPEVADDLVDVRQQVSPEGPGSQPMLSRISSSSIRYTLRDLLLAHLEPVGRESSKETGGFLPLSGLHLLLSKFDSFSLGLFDVMPDISATRFPFDSSRVEDPTAHHPSNEDTASEADESFQYPGAVDAASEAESFVYPVAGRGEGNREIDADQRCFGPSELELLLRLVTSAGTVDVPAGLRAGTATSPSSYFDVGTITSESGSSSHISYIDDAKAAIIADVSFRRGARLAMHYETEETLDVEPASISALQPPPDNFSSAASTAMTRSATAMYDPMTPHRLFTGSVMLRHICSHLDLFFVNPPQLNLVCTSVITKLATCPYRSLDAWLTPASLPLRKIGQAGMLPFSLESLFSQDELPPFAAARKPFELLQGGLKEGRKEAVLEPEDALIFAQLERLLLLVAKYRKEIRSFDRHLKERRDGMLFVEDLAEAIGGESIGPMTSEALSRPIMPRTGSSVLGSQSQLSSTPTRPKKASKSSLFGRYQQEQDNKAASSPYAEHYAQTSEMRVQAYVLLSEGESNGVQWKNSALSDGISDDEPNTPTRPAWSDQRPGDQLKQHMKKVTSSRTVSLSMLLDNVIILEEVVKELVALVVVRKSLGIDAL